MKFRLSTKLDLSYQRRRSVPLKTKENLEEYLQLGSLFFRHRKWFEENLEILEEIFIGTFMKADVIRNVSKKKKKILERFKKLCRKLNELTKLKFNEKSLFSTEDDSSFKLFKKAGSNAPKIKQPPVKSFIDPIRSSNDGFNTDALKKSLQALRCRQSDAAERDLQTSFTALTNEPEASQRSYFFEERVKHGFLRSSKEMMV